jgi:putative transposase
VTGLPLTAICQVLGMARRTAYYVPRARLDGRYHRPADATVPEQIRAVTNSRATYGYRRVWAMVNRTFQTHYNRKRIRRVMQLHGLMLAPRVECNDAWVVRSERAERLHRRATARDGRRP